jgi:SAM-dependent methyltransferase
MSDSVFDVRSRVSPLTTRVLDELLDILDVQGRKVLDLGCGAGFQSLLLASRGAYVIQGDIDPFQAATARQRLLSSYPQSARGSFAVNCEALPFSNAQFDFILTQSVLMYVNRRVVANEIFRCLRPGGHWILVEHLGQHPLLSIYRSVTPGRNGARWVQDSEWADIEKLFEVKVRGAHYLLNALTEVLLKLNISSFAGLSDRLLSRVDRAVLRRWSKLEGRCWVATRLLQKPK